MGVDKNFEGRIAFTSANDDVWPSFTVTKPQSKTYGLFGIAMTVVITVGNGSLDYTINGGMGGFGYDTDGNITGLVSGDGTVGLSYLIGKQHTAQSKSDLDALESAALFTLDIPANTLGPNSSLRVRTLWTTPTSGATKRLRGRFGGTSNT